MKRKINKYWFVVLFVLTILYCSFGYIADKKITLSGVTSDEKIDKFSVGDILNGNYQSSITNYWDQHMFGKNLLIKLRGQLMYSLLNVSPNSSVDIGKNKTLYEDVYITNELGINQVKDSNYFNDLSQKLNKLNTLLEKKGKLMYIFITPSKAHYFSDKLPWQFDMVGTGTIPLNNYNQFINMLSSTDLKYFDSRKYIDSHPNKDLKAPLFYRTGIHWSTTWGEQCAIAFANYISQTSKWNLGKFSLHEEKSAEPQWPDADLYQSLNLIQKPQQKYYKSKISVDKKGDQPNVFFRGGSFMGCSLSELVKEGVFNKDVHLENYYYFTDRYTKSYQISNYTAYNEMPIKDMINNTDILVLEVNEAAIDSMSFGFIDYLLDNKNQIL